MLKQKEGTPPTTQHAHTKHSATFTVNVWGCFLQVFYAPFNSFCLNFLSHLHFFSIL